MKPLLTKVKSVRAWLISARSLLFVLVLGAVLLEYLLCPFIRSVPEVPSFYESCASDSEAYAVLDLPRAWRIGWMEKY